MASKTPRTPTQEQLMKKFRKAMSAISHETEMVCVVMSATLIDHALGAILKKYFFTSSSTSDKLLKPSGTIGSLQAKVDVLYCLGLLSETGKDNIEFIARIRNKFAHSLDDASFEDPEICEWCAKLRLPEGTQWGVSGRETRVKYNLNDDISDSRERFEMVARNIGLFLSNRLNQIQPCSKLTIRWV